MARIATIFVLMLAALWASGCATLRPSDIPDSGPFVAVKDWQFSPTAGFPLNTAHHSFIDVRDAEGNCYRLEIYSRADDEIVEKILSWEVFEDERQTRPINLRALVTGPKALRIFEALKKNAARYEEEMHYVVVPGPNSNTFIETMLRQTPELSALLPHACVGKDFYSTFLIGVPGSGDGIEIETGIFGAEAGFSKGAEAHLFGLTFGVALFPPAIKLPGVPPLGWQAGTRVDHSEEYEPAAKTKQAETLPPPLADDSDVDSIN